MSQASEQTGHLGRNMVLFARLLRVGGLDVTPPQMGDWLEALERINVRSKPDFKSASRAILVRRYEDLGWFESAFELFWQARDPRELEQLELGLMLQKQTQKRQRGALHSLSSGGQEDDGEPQPLAAWSDRERLRSKDFAQLSAEETQEIKKLISGMQLRLETRKSRRQARSSRGRSYDLRRTFRRNLGRDELLELARRKRQKRRRPLVVLCDVSGSMDPYARLLLHFVYAISHCRAQDRGLAKVEAFAFGTRLTRLTRDLRSHDVDGALERASARIQDWGGGTRTGEALKSFNYDWSRRVLGRGAVVLIISDGWDRGDTDLLGLEMRRLHSSCHRLLWLNPLLGSPDYQPLTRGMQAALPHIDDFLPVHSLESLEQLGEKLESLTRRRIR